MGFQPTGLLGEPLTQAHRLLTADSTFQAPQHRCSLLHFQGQDAAETTEVETLPSSPPPQGLEVLLGGAMGAGILPRNS